MKIDPKTMNMLAMVTQLSISMMVPILGCFYIGAKLDEYFNKNGLFLTIFIILGVLSAFRNLYVLVMRLSKDDEDE